MIYLCKNKKPEDMLKELGFEKAPDKGYQIVLIPKKGKVNENDYRTMIPISRFHALVVGDEINLHLDKKKSKTRHKSDSRTDEVVEMVEKLSLMDNYVDDYEGLSIEDILTNDLK